MTSPQVLRLLTLIAKGTTMGDIMKVLNTHYTAWTEDEKDKLLKELYIYVNSI